MKNNSREGYLYILYHPSFLSYGENVYKLGMTINPKQRLQSYSPSFLASATFVLLSEKIEDCFKGEKILFYLLRGERLAKNREFFKVKVARCQYIFEQLKLLNLSQINHIYSQVCWSIVPLKTKLFFEQDPQQREKIEEELSKWSSNEWTNNMPYDEFLERFRFKPSKPEMYPEYILPEIKELNIMTSLCE
jgi:hypothetical protein